MGGSSRLCSVWLGSETGLLKGVSLGRRQAFNFCDGGQPNRAREVRALCWADPAQTALLLGSTDGTVRTFSTEQGAFSAARRCADPAEGGFSGLAVLDGSGLVTSTETGPVRVWGPRDDGPLAELDAGRNVCRMRQNPSERNQVGTGGKENGLKLWDLDRPGPALFSARNLRDDWLDLRRPHWVRDLAFLPDSRKVVTCTGHHQVHVFDPSAGRRPVLEAEFGEHPLTALALPAGGDAVAVGNARGQVALLDLRTGRVRGCLKGPAGAVRGLAAHATLPLVASCGLDRFLYVHGLDRPRPQHKVYLKSRLNCVLLSSRTPLDQDQDQDQDQGGPEGTEQQGGSDDEVWEHMERVGEGGRKRRRRD